MSFDTFLNKSSKNYEKEKESEKVMTKYYKYEKSFEQ